MVRIVVAPGSRDRQPKDPVLWSVATTEQPKAIEASSCHNRPAQGETAVSASARPDSFVISSHRVKTAVPSSNVCILTPTGQTVLDSSTTQ